MTFPFISFVIFLIFPLCVLSYPGVFSFQTFIFLKIFFYYCRRSCGFICYSKMWEFIEAFLFLVYWLYLFLTFSVFLYTHSQMRESSCRHNFCQLFREEDCFLTHYLSIWVLMKSFSLALLLEVNFMCLCQLSFLIVQICFLEMTLHTTLLPDSLVHRK